MSMYRCDDLCPSNEELALRIRDGDPHAAPLLLSQNEGYLTMLATSYCEQFSQDFLVDGPRQCSLHHPERHSEKGVGGTAPHLP